MGGRVRQWRERTAASGTWVTERAPGTSLLLRTAEGTDGWLVQGSEARRRRGPGGPSIGEAYRNSRLNPSIPACLCVRVSVQCVCVCPQPREEREREIFTHTHAHTRDRAGDCTFRFLRFSPKGRRRTNELFSRDTKRPVVIPSGAVISRTVRSPTAVSRKRR